MAMTIPNLNEVTARAVVRYIEEFAEEPTVAACAPGRVNLIGEHTDYNDGFVLPMALPMVTVVVGKSNNSKKCNIISLSDEIGPICHVQFEIGTHNSVQPGEPKWSNYIRGCIAGFDYEVPGFNGSIASSVPVGAGLSSSAALEVAMYTFLEALTGQRSKTLKNKALTCQHIEHEFVGVPCGIMDQFVSTMGKEGCALLIDCRDFIIKEISMLHTNDYVFLITNSNVPHKLSSSVYHERRNNCYEAAKRLNKKSLREATMNDIKDLEFQNVPEVLVKRTRHVVTEIERTLASANALEKGDFVKFGQLMNESHDSLHKDYEVSSEELNILVSSAREIKGVLGSRLTGAGFGGCTVTLMEKNVLNKTIEHIKTKYSGLATFYIAEPAKGAREMKLCFRRRIRQLKSRNVNRNIEIVRRSTMFWREHIQMSGGGSTTSRWLTPQLNDSHGEGKTISAGSSNSWAPRLIFYLMFPKLKAIVP